MPTQPACERSALGPVIKTAPCSHGSCIEIVFPPELFFTKIKLYSSAALWMRIAIILDSQIPYFSRRGLIYRWILRNIGLVDKLNKFGRGPSLPANPLHPYRTLSTTDSIDAIANRQDASRATNELSESSGNLFRRHFA